MASDYPAEGPVTFRRKGQIDPPLNGTGSGREVTALSFSLSLSLSLSLHPDTMSHCVGRLQSLKNDLGNYTPFIAPKSKKRRRT